ncbi:hypothetical protein PVAND_004136 [Polypedilum vanderplanki]|uniref:Cuticular protein n=1 Tax=Polypedilum vanderplanki TaxID=319348 RepID=A0A9J6BWS7_POLVA|nr:hypothetical protein PVAND_004136 [Polypedilum vanderplanki]
MIHAILFFIVYSYNLLIFIIYKKNLYLNPKFKLHLHLQLILVFLSYTSVCIGQDYDEYRPESRSLNGASRYQFAEDIKTTTTQAPIAILKQINRHNEDGSYTYGYEAADGSFKIETKAANGEVKGKYGYFDGERIRTVEYGADRFGFQPSGDGITVPPPTFHDDKILAQYDDEEEEQPQRQVVPARPKFVKQQQPQQPRPQAYNFAPAPVPRKQVIVTQAPPAIQQQYYDYEEEVIMTTTKPVQQSPPRPKFQQQPQFLQNTAPIPPRLQQFANALPIDIVYADERPSKPQQQSQYERDFESRQPQQFPSQDAPTPSPSFVNRPEGFPTLFSPGTANSRADVLKPKISKPTPIPTFANAPEQSFQFAPVQPQRSVTFPQSKPAQSRNTSILDQLAKDYALPQSSAPLHDISFGYSL